MKALIIKNPWIDYILDGKKTWEIRGCDTKIRGKIDLIQSGSGEVVGSCEIVESKMLSICDFKNNINKHYITHNIDTLPYKNTYAWVLINPKRYEKPIPYKHPKGAIIWVNIKER